MKQCYLIIIAIILIILVGLICFKLGFVVGKKILEPTVAQYKKLLDYYFPVPEDIFNISGKITEIQNNILSIEVIVQDFYALPEEWKTKIVKVIVTDETRITKFDMDTGKQIELGFSDLKVDDQIMAGAEENIKNKTEFEAKYIELFVVPEIPGPEME